ncbi:CPP1-like family protein [uncultured Prochlorococcus sp.]|uniref:CPP1-like family protein n=1 Tax=uncultured Prochlorococcus sp. TaxID=159733 RepID=UPI0032B16339
MDSNKSKNNPDKTPYEILGVDEGADFEDIQKARDLKVKEAGEDLLLKAKVESSFDQLLMGSLKARQSGNVSFEAQNASKKEKQINKLINNDFPLLSKIKNLNNNGNKSNEYSLPKITPPSFDNLSIKLSVGLLFLIILLISPDSYNRLLLSISTLILTYIQIKSGKKFISSLGWSVTFLSIGLIFGGLFETNSFIQEISNNSLSIQKIQSLPAMIILWIGVIFL